jgi:hypothetical protein
VALTYYTEHDSFDGMTVALQKLESSLKDAPAGSGLAIERSAGKNKHTCTPAGQGGCSAAGDW